MKNLLTYIVCLLLLLSSSCAKHTTVDYPLYPIVTAVVADKTTINIPLNNGSDSFLVNLSFTDGLGSVEAANTVSDSIYWIPFNHAYDSVVIADPFYNIYYYVYHASHLSSDSALNVFQTSRQSPFYYPDYSYHGTIPIAIVVGPPPTGTTDTLIYSFFIKDHAGKISNRVRTQPIIVNCY
jgi:hypothetical protein